ncbi:MAG: Wzz/FepE/Etk N-terminal domain-containing protein [Sphingobacteriales bacterium]
MEKVNSFNLMDIVKVIWDWRKKILLATFLVTFIIGVAIFLVPRQYLSEAIIVAANPVQGDRSNIFRNTFEQQFYYYGGEGDNDRLYEMARIDTMKKFLIDSFKLEDHYKISKTNPGRRLAAYNELKDNMGILKTELGHIQIKVWDIDKNLAADMVNAIIAKVNSMSIDLTNQAKKTILEKLEYEQSANEAEVKALLEKPNSDVPVEVNEAKRTSLLKQIEEKDNLINQFKTSLNDVTNVYVLEQAYPALKVDRPKRIPVVIMALLVSLFFSVLAALLLNRLRKSK